MANVVNMVGLAAQDKENQIIDGTLSTYWNPFISKIPSYAFANQSNLVKVDLSKATVSNDAVGAFSYCSNLRDININFESTYISFSDLKRVFTIATPVLTNVSTYLSSKTTIYEFCIPQFSRMVFNNVISFSSDTFLGGYFPSGNTQMQVWRYNEAVVNYSVLQNAGTIDSHLTVPIVVNAANDTRPSLFIDLPNCNVLPLSAFTKTAVYKVSIPNVTNIPSRAFASCYKLITFEDMPQVQRLYTGAFNSCISLQTVSFPEVLIIGEEAFKGCHSLAQIYFPKASSIGLTAFQSCGNLSSINLPVFSFYVYYSSAWTSIAPINFIFDSTIHTFIVPSLSRLNGILFCSAVIGQGYESVILTLSSKCQIMNMEVNNPYSSSYFETPRALFASTVKEVTLNGIESLDYSVPQDQSYLARKPLIFHSSITCIRCDDLTQYWRNTFRIPYFFTSSVRIPLPGGGYSISYETFSGNYTLPSILQTTAFGVVRALSSSTFNINGMNYRLSFPLFAPITALESFYASKLTQIYESTFRSCHNLKTVSIPQVISIYSGAFADCSSLRSITLPNIQFVDDYAFANCSKLQQFDGIPTRIGTNGFYGCLSLSSINLCNASLIGISAFKSCNNLSSIGGPLNSALSILNTGVFEACSNLTTIDITNVTRIDTTAFRNCIRLQSINLSNVTSVGGTAFAGCSSLESVDLQNVTSLGSSAFSQCSKLLSINKLSSALSIIKGNTFAYCRVLSSIDLSNINAIEFGAFSNCYNLSTIGNTSNLQTLSSQAFLECSSLESINLLNITQSFIASGTFSGCQKLSSITIPIDIAIISSYAFAYCSMLPSFSGKYVTTIGNNAFTNCTSLISIYFPYVWSLGTYIFRSCINLETAILYDESLTTPDGSALLGHSQTIMPTACFSGCTNLQYVCLPDCTLIGSYAFADCYNLSSVDNITESLSYIKSYAFQNCSALSTITLLSVEKLEHSVFAGAGLRSVYIYSPSVPEIEVTTFGGIDNSSITFYVLSSLVTDYQTTETAWHYYSSQIQAISE